MKRLILAIFLVYLCIQVGYSQLFISTESKTLELYDEKTQRFTTILEKSDEKTFFEINKDVTMMTHTTNDLTSFYQIKNWRKHQERESWEFEMISDVGNEYSGSLSFEDQVILFLYQKDNKTYVISFKIKKSFTKE